MGLIYCLLIPVRLNTFVLPLLIHDLRGNFFGVSSLFWSALYFTTVLEFDFCYNISQCSFLIELPFSDQVCKQGERKSASSLPA